MRVFSLLPILAALAACQPGAPEGEEPADAPAAAPEQPAAPTPGLIDMREVGVEGVGPLRADTPFDRDAIAALFPAAQVEAEFLHFGDETTPIITVAGAEETALEIHGAPDGNVGQVIVLGGPYVGPGGAQLMAGWPDLGVSASDCLMGEGRNVGQPICRRADAQNVAMVLAVPNWRGEGLPDPTTLNGRARLAAWIWTRP